MKRFEHKIFETPRAERDETHYEGEKRPWEDDLTLAWLDKLSEDGWEIVAPISEHKALFKRPRTSTIT